VKKVIKIGISILAAIAVIMCLAGCDSSNTRELEKTQAALHAAEEELITGSIIGRGFVDRYRIDSLDNADNPAKGFKVQLFQRIRLSSGTESVLVSEATLNSWGEYRFDVLPGEYYMIPVLSVDGYLPWDKCTWLNVDDKTLNHPRNLIVEPGEIVLVPTFLIR